MIVSEIKDYVKRQFGDESGVQVTDTDLIRWINAGQRNIVLENTDLLEKTATSNFVVDQNEYSLPADILIFKFISIKYDVELSYKPLQAYDFVKFNEYIDNWDGTTYRPGRPLVYTIHANKVIFFPTPDKAVTDGIKVYYNRKPVEVTVDGDTPDLPELYHDALVNYCMFQAHKMDEDYNAASAENGEMLANVAKLRNREQWKEQETYPVISVALEDM